ncbi:hypothetical protein CkaCkLH20_10939 [Colletotrichum karsti]|uniref:Uncharacterized protein n=1 Tax=Colletotrichum karsti TaxID=1095194 RepID=A0A9P6LFJ1_9PEZI|nr:uncharacterized protein CkaCkLH20_10939 [Colletotrichum karsti]KAF9871528.1 hypothetical protein CkaCkLH20_10939 [Colletotrichum karsti]
MYPEIPPDWADTLGDLTHNILIKYNFFNQGIWVKTTSAGSKNGSVDMLTFTGQPRKVTHNKHTGGKCCYLGARQFPTGWVDRFKCALPLGDFHDVDYVVPVFEITRNPRDSHPTPYVSVPLIGPWENWTQARRLALRIDHMKDGKIVGQYQHAHDHTFPFPVRGSPHNSFLSGAWSRAMAWIATLTNFEWADRSWFRHWALQPYVVTIEEIGLSYLDQSMVINQPIRGKTQEPPKRINVEVNMEELDKLYRRGQWEMPVDCWSPSLPSGRTTCDACHISMANPSAMHCPVVCIDCAPTKINIPNTNKTRWVCDFCRSLGRVCTFTPEDYLDLHFDTFKSLGYARVLGNHPEISSGEEYTARILLEDAAMPDFVKERNLVPLRDVEKDSVGGVDSTEGDGFQARYGSKDHGFSQGRT